MAVEIQQIVIRANATEMGSTGKKKVQKKGCEENITAENAQKTMDLVIEALKNKNER